MAEAYSNPILGYDETDAYYPEPSPPPSVPAWMDGGFRIGIHTSIAGDIVSALDRAQRLGANALQIFSSSPRMWVCARSGRIAEADAARFRQRRNELGLGPLVIHDNYLINLASPDRVLRTRSVQAFHEEIVRALALGADYLVAHPGCCRRERPDRGVALIAQGLRQAVRGVRLAGLRILLENTAGQGTAIGSRFAELRAVMDACGDVPMGVCLDTAHLFAAGHDIRSVEGLERTLDRLDAAVGLERVFVVHVNDSKMALGSRVDRHEHIGKGSIGLDAFGRIVNHRLLAGRAFILETPIRKPGDDRRNVRALWKLAGIVPRQARGASDGFPRALTAKTLGPSKLAPTAPRTSRTESRAHCGRPAGRAHKVKGRG